jgi:hypothetical protein
MQESELTPTGANLLDGRYAVFGYVTEGAQLLKEMQVRRRRTRLLEQGVQAFGALIWVVCGTVAHSCWRTGHHEKARLMVGDGGA